VRRQSGVGPIPLAVNVDGATLETTLTDGSLLWSPSAVTR